MLQSIAILGADFPCFQQIAHLADPDGRLTKSLCERLILFPE
jgi:hypothetical protein